MPSTRQRHLRLVLALVLLATPLMLVAADARHWAAFFRFCHTLWIGLTSSQGMVLSHLVLFVFAVWLLLRLVQFAATEIIQRMWWRKLIRARQRAHGDHASDTLIESERVFAFTAGWFLPRTYYSTGLCSRLTRRELRAVLHHEASHRRRRDPLRITLWKLADHLFPMLPYVNRAARAAVSEYEYIADRAAEGAGASRHELVSALQTTIQSGGTLPRFSNASFAAPVDLVNRLRLLNGESALATKSVPSLILSLLVLALFFLPSILMQAEPAQSYHGTQCEASAVTPAPAPMSEMPAGESSPVRQSVSFENL